MTRRTNPVLITATIGCLLGLAATNAPAASFDGNARVEMADSAGSLSCPATPEIMTVSCGCKIALGGSAAAGQTLTILANWHTCAENTN